MCLVPLADMFNHNCDSTTHNMVNTNFEANPVNAHIEYRIKKHKINLELFTHNPNLVFSKEDIQKNKLFR